MIEPLSVKRLVCDEITKKTAKIKNPNLIKKSSQILFVSSFNFSRLNSSYSIADPLFEIYDEPILARFWIWGQWTGETVSPLEGSLFPIQHFRWLGKWSKRPRMKTEPRSATVGSRTGKLPKDGVWKGCQASIKWPGFTVNPLSVTIGARCRHQDNTLWFTVDSRFRENDVVK